MSIASTDRRVNGPRKRSAGAAVARAGLLTPGLVLLALFAFLPLVALVITGFLNHDSELTLDNFTQVFTTPVYLQLLGRTLGIAFLVTVLSIALGWPAAWALARYVSPNRRSLILGLVIIPYITSQLLLIYGFLTLIQAGGPVSFVLGQLHLTAADDSILYSPLASVLMLVYESLPTAVLVMYSASEQIDGATLEAARTLGAKPGYILIRIILPLSSAMIVVNFTLTFVQTVGAFAEPGILGGPSGQMLGNAISSQISSGANQGFAVALSLVLLLSSLVIVGAVAALVAQLRRIQGGHANQRTGARHAPRLNTPIPTRES